MSKKIIKHGDPEPDRSLTLTDKQGDEWRFRDLYWFSPETAPFEWAEMHKTWFPMEARP